MYLEQDAKNITFYSIQTEVRLFSLQLLFKHRELFRFPCGCSDCSVEYLIIVRKEGTDLLCRSYSISGVRGWTTLRAQSRISFRFKFSHTRWTMSRKCCSNIMGIYRRRKSYNKTRNRIIRRSKGGKITFYNSLLILMLVL